MSNVGSRPPREPRTLTPQQLLAIVASVQELLWLRSDGKWDSEKEWDSEYITAVADTLTNFGLRPDDGSNTSAAKFNPGDKVTWTTSPGGVGGAEVISRRVGETVYGLGWIYLIKNKDGSTVETAEDTLSAK